MAACGRGEATTAYQVAQLSSPASRRQCRRAKRFLLLLRPRPHSAQADAARPAACCGQEGPTELLAIRFALLGQPASPVDVFASMGFRRRGRGILARTRRSARLAIAGFSISRNRRNPRRRRRWAPPPALGCFLAPALRSPGERWTLLDRTAMLGSPPPASTLDATLLARPLSRIPPWRPSTSSGVPNSGKSSRFSSRKQSARKSPCCSSASTSSSTGTTCRTSCTRACPPRSRRRCGPFSYAQQRSSWSRRRTRSTGWVGSSLQLHWRSSSFLAPAVTANRTVEHIFNGVALDSVIPLVAACVGVPVQCLLAIRAGAVRPSRTIAQPRNGN